MGPWFTSRNALSEPELSEPKEPEKQPQPPEEEQKQPSEPEEETASEIELDPEKPKKQLGPPFESAGVKLIGWLRVWEIVCILAKRNVLNSQFYLDFPERVYPAGGKFDSDKIKRAQTNYELVRWMGKYIPLGGAKPVLPVEIDANGAYDGLFEPSKLALAEFFYYLVIEVNPLYETDKQEFGAMVAETFHINWSKVGHDFWNNI